MNFTRNGKIARLPRAVRAELNQRLAGSEATDALLSWLNGLPDVQQMLADRFDSQPISEQNLSAWRQGGFTDWERAEGAREWAERLIEDCQDIEDTAGEHSLTERMAVPVLMELMQLLQTASTCENLAQRSRTVLGVARQITQLTRMRHEAERLEMERARWSYEQHQKDVEELTEMTSRERHQNMLHEALVAMRGETGPDSSEAEDSGGDEYIPGAYLGEEQEEPAAGNDAQSESSPIKVHQGVEKPALDLRAHFRKFELDKLRGKLLAEQTMPFRELFGPFRKENQAPEQEETTPADATDDLNTPKPPRRKQRKKPGKQKGEEADS